MTIWSHTFMNALSIQDAQDLSRKGFKTRDFLMMSLRDTATTSSIVQLSIFIKFLVTKVETISCRDSCKSVHLTTLLFYKNLLVSSSMSLLIRMDAESLRKLSNTSILNWKSNSCWSSWTTISLNIVLLIRMVIMLSRRPLRLSMAVRA